MGQENEMPRRLPLQSLEEMTNGFSDNQEIGRGGFGKVYLGVQKDGQEVAVKVLYQIPGRDDVQFDNEFYNLTRLQHRNIVRLVGFCHESKRECVRHEGKMVLADATKRVLCFEFMKNGSLDKYLSDESNGHGWRTRYKIIKGICNGLKYLHEELKPPIYHLDLKPGNVLLDENMNPKIADFGLSRLFGEENSQITKSSFGTRGYLPPEFIDKNIISNKLDIFSLGVVMIKIIAGPKGHTKSAEMPYEQFIQNVHGNWRNRLQAPSEDSFESYSTQVRRCIEIALSCVDADRRKRPTTGEVVNMLNETETSTNDKGASIKHYFSYYVSSPLVQKLTPLARNYCFKPLARAFAHAIALLHHTDWEFVLFLCSRALILFFLAVLLYCLVPYFLWILSLSGSLLFRVIALVLRSAFWLAKWSIFALILLGFLWLLVSLLSILI